MSKTSYILSASGTSNFFRAVSIPLAEAFSTEFENDDSMKIAQDTPDYLDMESQFTADGSILIGGIVGVFAFFGSWLAAKVLDDVYEAKFQPTIKRVLGIADDKLEGASASKPKMLQFGVSYADRRVFILIGIVGGTFAEILKSEHLIQTVHRNAITWIENNSSSEPIHLYIVNRGIVNIEPMRFDSLILAHLHIRGIELNS